MQRYSSLFIIVFLPVLLCVKGVSAFEISCPPPVPKTERELTPEYLSTKIETCLKARAERREAEVSEKEDFSCPSGNFFIPDGQPTSTGRIATQVSISIYLSEIDKEIMQYMCKLRETRETNVVIASNDVRITLEWQGPTPWLLEKYDKVCRVSFIMNHVNDPKEHGKKWVTSSEDFPESICKDKIERKKKAWMNLASILVSDGAAKGYQNDKDTFLDKVKTKYDTVREKFHALLQLLDKATKNLDSYIKRTVK